MGKRAVHLTEGGWVPWRTNWLVLATETFLVLQGASRGMDYVQPRPPLPPNPTLSVIEAALPLPLWGSGFLLFAGLVFIGLFGGWVWPIISGHLGLAGLYGAFSYGLLAQTPIRHGWLALIGTALLSAGLWLGIMRWTHWRWLRFTAAVVGLLAGGWAAAWGLGYDFRTGTGLLSAAASHLAFALGVTYIAYRRPPTKIT